MDILKAAQFKGAVIGLVPKSCLIPPPNIFGAVPTCSTPDYTEPWDCRPGLYPVRGGKVRQTFIQLPTHCLLFIQQIFAII